MRESFIDHEFPPTQNSLFSSTSTQLSQSEISKWKTFEWRRPHEIFKGHFKLFEGIEPNDINQGELGNCYFLSAVSALAEFPQRIKRIFKTDTISEYGAYTLCGYVNGEYREFTVDDYFPCKPNGRPVFTSTNQKEIWVMLLEKVWAKINGSYEITAAGNEEEAFTFLTGAPCQTHYHEDYEFNTNELWESIYLADASDYLICGGAGKDYISNKEFKMVGLISDHAYTIIQAKEVYTNRGIERIMQVRNPWGNFEWNGDWSDHSSLWTPELKSLLGYVNADDGTFFMSFNDYLTFFRTTIICKMIDNYSYSYLRSTQSHGDYSLFSISVPCPVNGFVGVSQINKRIMKATFANYQSAELKVMVGRKLEAGGISTIEYLGGGSTEYNQWNLEIKDGFKTGEYFIFVEGEWPLPEVFFVVSTYAGLQLPIQNVSNEMQPYFLNSILKSCAIKKTERKPYMEDNEKNIFKFISINDSKAKYGSLYYVNNSQSTYLTETCKFPELSGCMFVSPYQARETKVNLAPGQEEIFIIKMVGNQAGYSSSASYRVDKGKGSNSGALTEYQMLLYQKIIEEGSRTVVGNGCIVYDLHVKKDGVYFYFENHSSQTFNLLYYFTELRNLRMNENQSWEVTLTPGAAVLKKLDVIQINKGWIYDLHTAFL